MVNIEAVPISGGAGVEVRNIDLRTDMSDSDFASLRDIFFAHGLVFIHDQDITPEQHIAFAKRWGNININRFFTHVPNYPEIADVRKEPDQLVNIGGGWHTDHSYDQIPAMGSILIARETPPTGGDTLFACMYKAYETLSDGLKTSLARMRAVHSSRHIFGAESGYANATKGRTGNREAATQDATHPVVITHPESGRKALFVNAAFTLRFDGWTDDESKPLLNHLYRHAVQMEHTTRFQWRPGSIAFWDNRCTWHYALNDYHGSRRVMHRITVEGSPLS